jgi:hypothetical protein
MLIQKVDTSREVFRDYSLEGAVLTIGGIEVDLEAEQGEQEVIISISNHEGKIHRGMMACCEYVAEVIIPPRRYEMVEVEASAGTFHGGEGEEPATHTERVAVPLDMDSVVLKLWPAEDNRQEIIETAGGEENAD